MRAWLLSPTTTREPSEKTAAIACPAGGASRSPVWPKRLGASIVNVRNGLRCSDTTTSSTAATAAAAVPSETQRQVRVSTRDFAVPSTIRAATRCLTSDSMSMRRSSFF